MTQYRHSPAFNAQVEIAHVDVVRLNDVLTGMCRPAALADVTEGDHLMLSYRFELSYLENMCRNARKFAALLRDPAVKLVHGNAAALVQCQAAAAELAQSLAYLEVALEARGLSPQESVK